MKVRRGPARPKKKEKRDPFGRRAWEETDYGLSGTGMALPAMFPNGEGAFCTSGGRGKKKTGGKKRRVILRRGFKVGGGGRQIKGFGVDRKKEKTEECNT